MNRFLYELSEWDLILIAQQKELKKNVYLEQADVAFYILIAKNAWVTNDRVINILKEMESDDIIAELRQPFGKFSIHIRYYYQMGNTWITLRRLG